MTHEEALELVRILYFNLNEKNLRELNRTSKVYDKLDNYIKQQEKKDELLGLYKEINNKRKELITLARHNTWSWELDIEIKDIQNKLSKVGKEE